MTATRILEIRVADELVGTIKLQLNGKTTIVDGAKIISTGEYSMKPKEVEEMIHKRVCKKYVEIKKYQA